MDFKRAQQIINSDDTIKVLFDGSPVWIESLSPENMTARVKPLNGPGGTREVPVTELVEA